MAPASPTSRPRHEFSSGSHLGRDGSAESAFHVYILYMSGTQIPSLHLPISGILNAHSEDTQNSWTLGMIVETLLICASPKLPDIGNTLSLANASCHCPVLPALGGKQQLHTQHSAHNSWFLIPWGVTPGFCSSPCSLKLLLFRGSSKNNMENGKGQDTSGEGRTSLQISMLRRSWVGFQCCEVAKALWVLRAVAGFANPRRPEVYQILQMVLPDTHMYSLLHIYTNKHSCILD